MGSRFSVARRRLVRATSHDPNNLDAAYSPATGIGIAFRSVSFDGSLGDSLVSRLFVGSRESNLSGKRSLLGEPGSFRLTHDLRNSALRIALGNQQRRANRSMESHLTLSAVPHEQRDLDWRIANRLNNSAYRTIYNVGQTGGLSRRGHIRDVALNHLDSLLAVAGPFCLDILDVRTGNVIKRFPYPADPVLEKLVGFNPDVGVVFSADGDRLFVVSAHGELTCLDTQSWESVWKSNLNPTRERDFSRAGNLTLFDAGNGIAVASDRTIVTLSTADGTKLDEWQFKDNLVAIAPLFSGSTLVMADIYHCSLLDLRSGEETEFYRRDIGGAIHALDVDENGDVLIADENGSVIVVNPFHKDKTFRIMDHPPHDNSAGRDSFAPISSILTMSHQDYGGLITTGHDGVICIREPQGVARTLCRFGHLGPITCSTLSSNFQFLVTGGADGTVRFWDLRSSGDQSVYGVHRGVISTVTAGENTLAVDFDGRISTLPDNSFEFRIVYDSQETGKATSIASDAAGQQVIAGFADGTIGRLNLEQSAMVGRVQVSAGSIEHLDVSRDGRRVVAVDEHDQMFLLDSDLNLLAELQLEPLTLGVYFSSDGSQLAVVNYSNTIIQRFDARTLEKLGEHDLGCDPIACVASNDRTLLALGGHISEISVLEWGEDLSIKHRLFQPTYADVHIEIHSVADLQFSHDNQRLYASFDGGAVTSFDLDTESEVVTLLMFSRHPRFALRHQDNSLVVFDGDGGIHHYGVEPFDSLVLKQAHTWFVRRVRWIDDFTVESESQSDTFNWVLNQPASHPFERVKFGEPFFNPSRESVDAFPFGNWVGFHASDLSRAAEQQMIAENSVLFSEAWLRREIAGAERRWRQDRAFQLLVLYSVLMTHAPTDKDEQKFRELLEQYAEELQGHPGLLEACDGDPLKALPNPVARIARRLSKENP